MLSALFGICNFEARSWGFVIPADAKLEIMSDIREAVEEMKLIRAGKKQARDADDFLNEL